MQILKFYSSFCAPCKALDTQLKRMYPLIQVRSINTDSDGGRRDAVLYGIRSVPTLVLLDEAGVEYKRLTGSVSDAKLEEFFE
jgi:thiol-disulfide isomerase/thioredoxin